MNEVKALSLFSGGLDSILASRLVAAQGIEVQALKFVSPFFNYDILEDVDGYKEMVRGKYGVDVIVKDITADYMELLYSPVHGFGKNFNPCIDCKILMLRKAKEMMDELNCSFLITGEVLGQRPMSQRRDTLNVIERDSDNKSILLRPLSAQLLPETDAEKMGLVDRDQLLNFSGRGRSRQIALAKEFGITDFPSPAGGCILADPILGKRVECLFSDQFVVPSAAITPADILLILIGRQFVFPSGRWLVLGRNEKENEKISRRAGRDDILFVMEERPGPTAVLRNEAVRCGDKRGLEDDLATAAGLVVRYGKKVIEGPKGCRVKVLIEGDDEREIYAEPLTDDIFREWMVFV